MKKVDRIWVLAELARLENGHALQCYSQFRVIRVGEFGLNPSSLSQSLIILLGTLVLLVAFNRGMH